MSKEVEHRRYAASLLDIAARARTAADKLRLLVMAEAWVALADKFARMTKWHRVADPAIHQTTVGPEPSQNQPGPGRLPQP